MSLPRPSETKYILRMKDMDLRIMAMEWGVEKEKIMRVREAIRNYKVEREVVKVVEDPLITLRNSLTYGKMVVSRLVVFLHLESLKDFSLPHVISLKKTTPFKIDNELRLLHRVLQCCDAPRAHETLHRWRSGTYRVQHPK